MTTIAKPIELRIGIPEAYDGSFETLRQWLNGVQLYLLMNKDVYNNDDKKIVFVLSYMTKGPALTWATTFQWFMNDSFCNIIAEGWQVIYMDDLLIYSPNTTTHTKQTKRVLQYMIELNLHLKLERCIFTTPEVEYLGMIVKPSQLAMDLVKLNGIAYWPTPSKVKDICSFLGFANFYCQFISNYSTLTHPLINLIKKNLPWNWTASQQHAFDQLKCLFLSEPVLHIPNLSSSFAIATNTCEPSGSYSTWSNLTFTSNLRNAPSPHLKFNTLE